jgi:glycosyltransferase involved in cell wall biosynthesis
MLINEKANRICVDMKASEIPEAGTSRADLYTGNKTISTIMRFHKKERLPFLEEALFSLAIQYWHDQEVIVVLQNGTDELKRAVLEMIDHQPWQGSPSFQVLIVEIPAGMDGRSTLLNRGIAHATGRYLAFLDDDDVVYQHGYTTLINQLVEGEAAVAVGGCRTAKVNNESGHWYVQTKETPFSWGRTRYDLFRDNFIPIHSYVIDRARVDAADLYFDDAFPPLEDYDFLLRLSANHEFDFSQLDIPVCEYRIHGSNSIPYSPDAPPEAFAFQLRAQELIKERKKSLICAVPLNDLVELQEALIKHEPPAQPEPQSQSGEPQESQLFQKFLDTVGNNIYAFFRRHPRVEKRLSNITHSGWRAYKRIRSPRSGD